MIRWLDHTADVRLEIVSETVEGLYADFVEGLKRLLVTGDVRPAEAVEIELDEPDSSDLLVSLGRQVLFYFNTSQFVPARFDVTAVSPTHLRGRLWGEPFDPDRMAFHLEVKGVTYHGLEVKEENGEWKARVTFDV